MKNYLKKNYVYLDFKKICSISFIVNLILVSISSLYLYFIFKGNIFLYYINILCFYCLYFCSILDLYSRFIFVYVIYVFSIPIILLNYFGGYTAISLISLTFAVLLYSFIYALGRIVFRKEVFGIGDIYIIGMVGLATDWNTVLNIGLFSFINAGVFYLVYGIVFKKYSEIKKKEIPFIPFILVTYLIFMYI